MSTATTPVSNGASATASSITAIITLAPSNSSTSVQFHAAGSLKTIFTRPPDCPDDFDDSPVLIEQRSSCYPPNFSQYRAATTRCYYSPAICPLSYTAAATRPKSGLYLGPTVASTETAMFCCPSGYTFLNPLFCTKGVASLQRVPIQIRWASSDLSDLETHPLTPGLHYPFTATVTQTPNPSNPSSAGSGGNGTLRGAAASTSSGLSTGAKIGIGVGVPIGVILLLVFGVLLFLRRRRWRKRAATVSKGEPEKPADEIDLRAQAAPEVCDSREAVAHLCDNPGYEHPVNDSSITPSEVYGSPRHEASGSELHEAPPNVAAAELPNRSPSTRTRQTVAGSIASAPRELSADPGHIELEEPSSVEPSSFDQQSRSMYSEAASTADSTVDTSHSTDPLVASLVGRDEIAVLRERQVRLQAKRNRLLELQKLEEEEEEVRQQIAQAKARSRQGAG